MRTAVKAFPDEPNPKGYWANLREAISQCFGALVGLNANLTLSAYCGYWRQRYPFSRRGHAHIVVNFIVSIPRLLRGRGIDHQHCKRAWEELT